MQIDHDLVTTLEAANILEVHHKTVTRLVRKGTLPAIKLANRWFISREILENYRKTYIGKKGRPKGWSPKKRDDQLRGCVK